MARKRIGKGTFGGRAFGAGSASGKPSSFGGAKSKRRSILNPWGNNVPKDTARRANGVGQTPFRSRVRPTGAIRKPTPDRSLFGMGYKRNDPNAWPIEGGKADADSGMTQDKANFNNSAVNHAFERGGYAG